MTLLSATGQPTQQSKCLSQSDDTVPIINKCVNSVEKDVNTLYRYF